jgi:uncharacterized membrane protein
LPQAGGGCCAVDPAAALQILANPAGLVAVRVGRTRRTIEITLFRSWSAAALKCAPMQTLLNAFSTLPWPDWLALALFFAGWVGYAHFAKRRSALRPSILVTTNQWRRRWMLQATFRDNRIVDSAVTQSMSASPTFFASTSILIIGGLLASLGATEKASELVRELPFAARTSVLVFDLKLGLLAAIFVNAFFGFTWSIRQYSFGAIMIGAAPEARDFVDDAQRQVFADRAGRIMGLAAETFNQGLRAYYLSFAAVAWFFSPWAFMGATALVIWVLYRREFHSEVLVALREGLHP